MGLIRQVKGLVCGGICGLCSTAGVHMGDFNVVRRPDERHHGFDGGASADFNGCIEDINMQKMPTKGFWYT